MNEFDRIASRGADRWAGFRAASGRAIAGLFVCALLLAALTPTPSRAAPSYSAIVIDAKTGKVLHEKNSTGRRYPASLTKIMTLYIMFEMLHERRITYDTELVITRRAARQTPSKLGLRPGQKIRVIDAIRALVTKSANDVATAVAENLAGTEARFARYMTWKARQLGMTSTTFRNASGLPDTRQVTTARDMARLALRLNDHFPKLYQFFRTKTFVYRGRRYRNHNRLLFNFRGTDGIKTGYTRSSGFNLVASVRRDGKHVIGVVIGGRTGRQRNAIMRRLLARGLKKASRRRTRKISRRPVLTIATTAARPAKRIALKVPSKTTGLAIAPARSAATPAPSKTTPPPTKTVVAGVYATPKLRGTTIPADTATPSSEPVVAAGSALTTTATSALATAPGPFHVQVGSNASAEGAKRKLETVRRKAGSELLAGHKPVMLTFTDARNKTWYRSRFAGFSKDDARATCRKLKRKRIDCVVMSAP